MKEMSKKNSIEQVLKESFELWKSTIKYIYFVFVIIFWVVNGFCEYHFSLYWSFGENSSSLSHNAQKSRNFSA